MHDSLIGTVVDGRYAISASLGRGGMATVYRARDKRLERNVAVKLMHPHLAAQPDFITRFNREARSAAQLSHPHVVAVHDQGIWNGHPYLVMEYIPGPDARSELARMGSLTLGTALTIVDQVLEALSAAHTREIVHRDVKPENVLLASPLPAASSLDRSGINAKVADFGLARAVSAQSTATGYMLGTVAYMAPELITDGHASAQSDLYAVGIMFYEFLTGSLPFEAATPIATAYKHLNTPMPRVAEIASWIPDSIDSFIGLLTAKDPTQRPEDASAAAIALRTLIRSIPEDLLLRRVPVFPPASAQPVASPTLVYGSDDAEASPSEELTSTLVTSEPLPTQTLPHIAPAELPVSDTVDTAPVVEPSGQSHLSDAAVPEVSQSAKPRKKRRLWPVFLIAALLLGGSGTGAWYFLAGPGQRVEVPNLVQKSYDDAVAVLTTNGLKATRAEAYSDEIAAGYVIKTSPDPGGKVHPDNPVTVTVSLGIEQVTVPSIVGLTKDKALESLAIARLTPEITEDYSEDIPAGEVVSQSLKAKTKVNHDSVITVVISKGREPINVPDVSAMTGDEAKKAVEGTGLSMNITEQFSDSVAAGKVMSQSPTSGTLHRGDTINVTVSKGPELFAVPDVTLKSVANAKSILEAAGFKVQTANIYGGILGVVRFQDPKAGTMLPKGSTIKLSVI